MVKAIDTQYKGYKFRSRLEARFAVFLDAMGISWDYEVQGYDLPINGRYLPDFYLPNGDLAPGYSRPLWIEVKAGEPTLPEINKLRELAVTTKTAGAFFQGTCKNGDSTFSRWLSQDYDSYSLPVISKAQLPLSFYVAADQRMPSVFWEKENEYSFGGRFIQLMGEFPVQQLRRAAKSALSARFEFGESC